MPSQTGPKTAEGKAKSSRNSLKFGLYSASLFVLANEDPNAWEHHLAVWTAKLQPADEAEHQVVLDIAHAQWRMRRARTIERDIFDIRVRERRTTFENNNPPGLPDSAPVADAFRALSDYSKFLENLNRYETRARRAFDRGMAALRKLQVPRPPVQPPARPIVQPKPPAPTATQNCKNEIPSPVPLPPGLAAELDAHRRRDPLFDPRLDASQMSRRLRRWFERQAA